MATRVLEWAPATSVPLRFHAKSNCAGAWKKNAPGRSGSHVPREHVSFEPTVDPSVMAGQ